MEENMQHFKHIILYYFKKGKNATETQKKNCAVYGEGAVTDRTCQKWFAKFCTGDSSQLGKPVEVDNDQIETLIEIKLILHEKQLTYSKYPNQSSYW